MSGVDLDLVHMLCFSSKMFNSLTLPLTKRRWIPNSHLLKEGILPVSLFFRNLNFPYGDISSPRVVGRVSKLDFSVVIQGYLFVQVLIVQAVRPDRLQSAMSLFASKALGKIDVH